LPRSASVGLRSFAPSPSRCNGNQHPRAEDRRPGRSRACRRSPSAIAPPVGHLQKLVYDATISG
jgi:hypothetical protein